MAFLADPDGRTDKYAKDAIASARKRRGLDQPDAQQEFSFPEDGVEE